MKKARHSATLRFAHLQCWILLLGLWLPTAPLAAAQARFESAESQTSLVELFTSEGCSSCPPIEHWLSSLRDAAGLWKDFVPVAFHVD